MTSPLPVEIHCVSIPEGSDRLTGLIACYSFVLRVAGIWLHVEGENTPQFNGIGFVSAPDRAGTLIDELADYLDYAATRNVFVIIVLWNGALMRVDNYKNLVLDINKLDSYISNALRVSEVNFCCTK